MAGSIEPRGKGVFRLRVEGPPKANGKRRYVTRTHHGTARSAETALARLLVEVGRGEHVGEDATVADLLESWMRVASIEESTRRDYRSVIDCHLVPRLGKMKVHQVRPSHLDQMYVDLSVEAGLGPDRIKKVHNVLSRAFRQAVAWQWVVRNPCRDASPPSVPTKPVRAPSVPDVQKLLQAADDELLLWLRLSATLGARRGEVGALRWSCIDFKTRELVIAEALTDAGKKNGKGGIVRKETKTRNQRRIAIDESTMAALYSHRKIVVERALACGVALDPDGYVISRDVAGITPWRPDWATKQFRLLRQSLGLPAELKMKDLRHFVATQMLGAGVDVRSVAGRLGHSRPSTTLDKYAAFIPARDRDAAETLGRLLG